MDRVGLKEAIQAAYEQLHAAVTEIPLRDGLDFRYESIELELNVEVDETQERQGDVKFWVVGGSGKSTRTDRSTHLVKVAITPLWRSRMDERGRLMDEINARGVRLSDSEVRNARRRQEGEGLNLSHGYE
ncbi:trypco2 family protein [Streptomyces rochei]|uniref:trypco2 family protein n=1 Tax=Streptomyces rochei TaxID=1928 RepID=UPI0036751A0C